MRSFCTTVYDDDDLYKIRYSRRSQKFIQWYEFFKNRFGENHACF